jgi:hypothetical protein
MHQRGSEVAVRIVVLLLSVVLLCPSLMAQSNSYDEMRPPRGAHPMALASEVKIKLKLAFEAVVDLETLASGEDFRAENMDAKRAIREANVVSETKEARTVLNDIETFRLTKEACRPVSEVNEFRQCNDVSNAWADRIMIELGRKSAPPTAK